MDTEKRVECEQVQTRNLFVFYISPKGCFEFTTMITMNITTIISMKDIHCNNSLINGKEGGYDEDDNISSSSLTPYSRIE